ncbi:hypothetical protein ACI3E1_07400 [Ligilactobacillus sp. LYQ139]|uniref:hypothetical protein n=1 Tax=Ligilactobacillus sp. LYQ139 TaxID=3378800 RepID=UPI003854E174
MIEFTTDTNGPFTGQVLAPHIKIEGGIISNVYFFSPDNNGGITTLTIENSEMVNSPEIMEMTFNNKVSRAYGLSKLNIHNNLAFYIILAKGFSNDWASYIVTYKFYDNYKHYFFGVNQPNILVSTNYDDLSKCDIDTIKEFYTKVMRRLKEINFIR